MNFTGPSFCGSVTFVLWDLWSPCWNKCVKAPLISGQDAHASRQSCALGRISARYFLKRLSGQSKWNGPRVSEAPTAVAGGRGLPLPLGVLLRFWSQKDLAFCIPGIPTSVPPRLLIIAACALHNHSTARGDRGSPSAAMRLIWRGGFKIK